MDALNIDLKYGDRPGQKLAFTRMLTYLLPTLAGEGELFYK